MTDVTDVTEPDGADILIVPYSEQWDDSHRDFVTRTYPGKRRRADAGYLRWKFRGPATGEVPGLLLAIRDDTVVGRAGFLPGKAWLAPGETKDISWLCELMVEPSLRRLGINRMLYDVAFARDAIQLGPDPSEKARKSLARIGMEYIESSWIMILPLRVGPVVATRYPQAEPVSRLLSLVGAPAIRWRNRSVLAGAASPAAQVCRWTDVADLVAEHEASITMPHAIHDHEFLAWRAQGLDGWTREVDAVRTRRGSYALLERDDRRLVVHQWRAVDDTEAAALFGRIAYIAAGYGLDFVQTYAADETEKAMLERLAFGARRTRTDMSVFPGDALAPYGNRFAFMGYDSDYML